MLRQIPQISDPRALVGINTRDDAAVYRLTDELALVATVDYITPVVDDPFTFGQIAATNALSDVYAMGAEPLFALNLVNFPRDALPLEQLGEIVRGGADKATEAGIAILGGHSVDDPEIKYGMTVIGMVHPDEIIRNVNGQPGDVLVLTKPLGTGIISTAAKADRVAPAHLEAAVRSMTTLNRGGASVMRQAGAHAATDVTGFGFLGHLSEMLSEKNLDAIIETSAVPLLPGARELAEAGIVPGGTRRNLEALSGLLDWSESVDSIAQLLLCDAQTSGGLLIAVPAGEVDSLLTGLRQEGTIVQAVIGRLAPGSGRIHIDP